MYLLDTNVVSELRKVDCDQRVLTFISATPRAELFISDVSLAEIRYGIEAVADRVRREDMQAWLNERIRPYFAGRVLTATEDVWVEWKSLQVAGRRLRYTYPQPDLVIASIALRYGLAIVSRDTEPFRRAKVPVINPWRSANR